VLSFVVSRNLGVVLGEGGLPRRAEGRRHVGPPRSRRELLLLVRHAEGSSRLTRDVEVEGDPAAADERPEVHDWALERGHVTARGHPFHGHDRLSSALGGLGDRVCLEDAGSGKTRGVVEVPLARTVESVVGGAVHRRPRTGGE
jgi:hypothetical protein